MGDYFNGWNKPKFSVNNSNLQEFIRDYDKNPIIIKSYELFFILANRICVKFFAAFLSFVIYSFFYDLPSYFNYFGFIGTILIFLPVLLMFFILAITGQLQNSSTIEFRKKFVIFYDNNILKRKWLVIDSDNTIYNTLSPVVWMLNSPISFSLGSLAISLSSSLPIIFWIYLLQINKIDILPFISLFILFLFIGQILINILCFVFINRCKNFKFLPFLYVAIPSYKFVGKRAGIRAYGDSIYRYYLVYLYDRYIYDELKAYYKTKNIDLDKVRKNFMAF